MPICVDMIDPKKYPKLAESAKDYTTEVLILADAVGDAKVPLVEVMQDFLRIVRDPIIAGGFATAHHGFVRGTVDIDVIAVDSSPVPSKEFISLGYKYEEIRIPIGSIELLSKGGKGVDFLRLDRQDLLDSIVSRAVPGTFLTEPVRMVSLEDLILLKMLALSGRKSKKDELDFDYLVTQDFDRAYVDSWKVKLGIVR